MSMFHLGVIKSGRFDGLRKIHATRASKIDKATIANVLSSVLAARVDHEIQEGGRPIGQRRGHSHIATWHKREIPIGTIYSSAKYNPYNLSENFANSILSANQRRFESHVTLPSPLHCQRCWFSTVRELSSKEQPIRILYASVSSSHSLFRSLAMKFCHP